MSALLEIACFSAEACRVAQEAGAHRIELCDEYCSGGITPQREVISKVRRFCNIPLHVIIRPRSGNFIYTAEELERMKQDIIFCRDERIDGVVFGALDKQQQVDVSACRDLIRVCGNMSLTFHRAIDECVDIHHAIKLIAECGFHRVLTSGAKSGASEGIEEIKRLQQFWGHVLKIMPGGGVRPANLKKLVKESGCGEFHSAATKAGEELPSAAEIKKMLAILQEA